MTITSTEPSVGALWEALEFRIARGERFAGLFADRRDGGITLSAQVAVADGIDTMETALPPGVRGYPALTPRLGAAFWYERVIHDQAGLVPEGHPRLAPLIRPGSPGEYALPLHTTGYGLFTIPHGPVRSGVFESMEYLVETPGEAIPHLNMRIFYKHRGIASRFAGLPPADGVLLAERAEGIASVAHALAFCHAVEAIAGCRVPREATLIRVMHAELERIANHLDVAVKLADAAGLAVATARFSLHKERVMRLISALCGSRFGRGVVVPGGVAGYPRERPAAILARLGPLEKQVTADVKVLMGTSSFLDRLRGTGPLVRRLPGPRRRAVPRASGRRRAGSALGPLGRGRTSLPSDQAGRRQFERTGGRSAPPPLRARRGQGDRLGRGPAG
jgi:formate hydrogenlyase subunit 5